MNKKFMTITALTAALLMLTSCGTKDDSTADENEASTTVSEQTEEVTAAPEASDAAEDETADDTESEKTEETVSETDEEPEEEAQISTFDGGFYTIAADTSKWVDFSEYKQLVAEAAESLDNGLDLTAEDYSELCDVMYMYTDVSKNVNVNVVSTDLGVDMDMDAEAVGPIMAESFDAIEGYSCDSWEAVTINGENALKINVSAVLGDYSSNMVQYEFIKGGKQIAVTLTVTGGEPDDAVLADFDALVNTVAIK